MNGSSSARRINLDKRFAHFHYCLRCLNQRKIETESRPFSFDAAKDNCTTLFLDHFLGQEETKAGPVRANLLGIVGPKEFSKEVLLGGFRHADTGPVSACRKPPRSTSLLNSFGPTMPRRFARTGPALVSSWPRK